MKTSEMTDKIIPALVKAQKKISNPHLNAEVKYGTTNFKYADLAACLEAVRMPLLENEIVIVQDVAPLDGNGVSVATRFLHTSGQWIESSPLPMPVKANDPQAVGSATTYGKRYTLCSLAGIVAEADDDGQKAQQAKPEAMPVSNVLEAHNTAARENAGAIAVIKTGIASGDLYEAVETWNELPEDVQRALWVAPSKGGIFTTEERKTIKGNEWFAISSKQNEEAA